MWSEQPRPVSDTGRGFYVVRNSDVVNPYLMPSSTRLDHPISGVYNAYEGPAAKEDDEFSIVTEMVPEDEVTGFPWTRADGTPRAMTLPITNTKSGYSNRAFQRHIKTFQNGHIKRPERDQIQSKYDDADDKSSTEFLYGNNKTPIYLTCFVRCLLIAHNVLTVWRVTDQYNENLYWLMVIANFFLLLEGMVVIITRAGMEYSWWCPCFLIYLASTIPAIWLLQLNQHDRFVNADKWTTPAPLPTTLSTSSLPTTIASTASIVSDIGNITTSPLNVNITTPTSNTTLTTTPTPEEPVLGTLDNDVWVIIIEESLVYLLVFSRWLLPRGKVSRDFLADLLLEFLAIASDIMELLAVFDQDEIRGNLNLTYAIMAVWSASFIQFIPILMQRKRFRKVRNPNVECLTRYFGDKFVEIVVTCMSIFLQDLPFLVIRLYIIIDVNLITYSLIFFVLKNIVSLLLLSYRLCILCYNLPHCKRRRALKAIK